MLDAEIGRIAAYAFYVALAIYVVREIRWQITAPKKKKQAELEKKEAEERSRERCFCRYFRPYGGPNGNYSGLICENCRTYIEQGGKIDDSAFAKYCTMSFGQYPWSEMIEVDYESAGKRMHSRYWAPRMGLFMAYKSLCYKFNARSSQMTEEEFNRQLTELFDTFIRVHETKYAEWQRKIEAEKRIPRKSITAEDIMARKTGL